MPRVRRLPKIEISPLLLSSVALHLYFGLSAWLKDLFLAALLHECAHMFVLHRYRIPIQSIQIRSLGATIGVCEIGYRQEILCAAAGPAVNVLLAAVFRYPAPLFSLCNLGLFLWNLLPIHPLDGGRILRAILRQRHDLPKAEWIEFRVALYTTVAVMLTSIILSCCYTHNLFPPLLAAFVLLRPVTSIRSDKSFGSLPFGQTAHDDGFRS